MRDKFEMIAGCTVDDFLKKNISLWRNKLYSYCEGDLDLVDDIISDSILCILTNLDQYDSNKSKFTTWCYTIVINQSYHNKKIRDRINYINYDNDILSKISQKDDDISDIISDENYNIVLSLIDNLINDNHKTAIKMKYIENMTLIQIANKLNVSVQRVKTWLFDGKKRIRNEFSKKQLND